MRPVAKSVRMHGFGGIAVVAKHESSADEYRRRISRAIDYINVHLADNPSVAQIAAAAPFSSFHFQRLFRAYVGESVAQFTRRLRLEAAARRLAFAKVTDITELSMELGFSSSQNFAKAFRKHFGVSPSAYRDEKNPAVRDTERAPQSSAVPDVVVRSIASMRVAYLRHLGSYDAPGIQSAFDQLQRWAEARELHSEDCYLGIPWDEATITPDDRCRFDACLIVEADAHYGSGVNLQNIPAGRYATHRAEIECDNFDGPWSDLMRNWLPAGMFCR